MHLTFESEFDQNVIVFNIFDISYLQICHVTASKTNPYTVIQVDESALPAHEAHQRNGNRDVIPAGLTGCSTSAWTNNDDTWTLAPKPRDFADDRCALP